MFAIQSCSQAARSQAHSVCSGCAQPGTAQREPGKRKHDDDINQRRHNRSSPLVQTRAQRGVRCVEVERRIHALDRAQHTSDGPLVQTACDETSEQDEDDAEHHRVNKRKLEKVREVR